MGNDQKPAPDGKNDRDRSTQAARQPAWPQTCQWLHGDSRDRNFCGAPVRPGSSFCPAHHDRVWQPAPRAFTDWLRCLLRDPAVTGPRASARRDDGSPRPLSGDIADA